MPEPPPFSPTVTLLTVGRVWEAAFADALKPLGLTTRKYALLGSRCRARTPPTT